MNRTVKKKTSPMVLVGVLLICIGMLGLSFWFLMKSISDIGTDRVALQPENIEAVLEYPEQDEATEEEKAPVIIDAEIIDAVPEDETEDQAEQEVEKPEDEEPERAEETEKPMETPVEEDPYLLPSDQKLLTAEDVSHLSSAELRIARNEIYARHGRKFQSADLQEYFNQQSWYDGRISPNQFNEDVLSDIEQKNAEFLFECERKFAS